MARSVKRRGSKKRGGGYGSSSSLSSASPVNIQKGGVKRQSKKTRRQTLTRKQKRTRKQRKSFLSTLNQMGGYIRDGSTQFFKRLSGKE